ncbi:hypothetical protein [Thermoanaerobacterium sp. RBIITD]|uniref:hypothetical protein n=1 Tax=Thermoanaerobacterium sp. RBIITD TaxID=1550240 RepID=UPI000BBF4D78|nr:hypothetical protein [Thermoanaerobacterium sp. RBIITD]SNX55202.1 hypothetical protein SAMN05660242_3010 [Thermoanaerobacterium sp. RBIITD]
MMENMADITIENSMTKIKQKILNDDIMSRALNGEDLTVKEGKEDWEIEFGKNIVDLYKELSKIVRKIK